jgi:hypothetical protein
MKQPIDSFWIWGGGLAALVVAAGAAVYFYQRDSGTVEPNPVAAVPEAPSAAEPTPRPVEIVPPAPQRSVPLPALDESDAEIQGGLTELVGPDAVMEFLVPERIIRKAVVTIDNAAREKMAFPQRPFKPTGGKFAVSGADETLVIAPANYSRYKAFVTVVENVDASTLVALYRGLQPLFQEAYEELGNPNELFNTRLLEVIDHLLQTPDVTGPVRLVQPSVYYRYADPTLESLSSGQKVLIRMGPENAGIVKSKLRQIQAALS